MTDPYRPTPDDQEGPEIVIHEGYNDPRVEIIDPYGSRRMIDMRRVEAIEFFPTTGGRTKVRLWVTHNTHSFAGQLKHYERLCEIWRRWT